MDKNHFDDFVLWFIAWLLSLVTMYANALPVDRVALSGEIDAFLRTSAGQAYEAGTGVDIGQTTEPRTGDVATPNGIEPTAQAVKSTATFAQTQTEAMDGLLADAVNGIDEDDLLRRLGFYGNALSSQYWRGMVEETARTSSADTPTGIEWRFGATECHCTDCVRMAAGSPWSPEEMRRIGLYPQSYDLECHGFYCTCTLRAVALPTEKSMNNMAMRNVLKSIAVKGATVDATDGRGTVKCYPSVMGNLDSYADVIFPNAFKSTGCLPGFVKRGFTTMDHVWEWSALVGYPTMAEERGNKLYSEFTFHSDPNSQNARVKCQERIDDGKDVGLSIGFSMMPGDYAYFNNGRELLDYAKKKGYDLALFDTVALKAWNEPCQAILAINELFEYSLTPSPANREAIALWAKSAGAHHNKRVDVSARGGDIRVTNMKNRLKTICGSLSLPLAPVATKWNAKDAIERIKALTGATDEPNAEFAKAFIVVDGDNAEFNSYKLPFADVVAGKMHAVYPALKVAAGFLNGDHAGVGITDEATEGAKRFVEGYYRKASTQFEDAGDIRTPWASESTGGKFKGQYLGEYLEVDMTMSAMYEGFYSLYYECGDCLAGYGDYADMTMTDRMSCMSAMFDEYKNLCLSIADAIATGSAEDGEMAAKTARKLTTSQLGNLGDGLPYSKHARIAVDATAMFIERTSERCAMRRASTPPRELSAADLQTIMEARSKTAESLKQLDALVTLTEPRNKAQQEREARLKALRFELARREVDRMTSAN